MIRGHEKVDDSLAELIQGELMDGDNKVMCDVCAEKKAVVRRTCIGKLPNMLVLHLKRFDLDFTTFETVKLNTRMGFNNTLNMLKYTKEGIDVEERQKRLEERQKTMNAELGSKEQEVVQLEYEDDGFVAPDALDYEYELGGVLVHAGVAQGGHYYSFIRDTDGSAKWYRFEDDEVSAFNPEQIPYQCYGGMFTMTGSGGLSGMDEERTSNALLLFYRKVRPSVFEPIHSEPTTSPTGSNPWLVDGCEAFMAEVKESNERHVLLSYLLDHGFQPLVRELLFMVLNQEVSTAPDGNRWITASEDANLVEKIIQLGCVFVVDVVLHVKERAGMQQWIALFKVAFSSYPSTAMWFIKNLFITKTWLSEYLSCIDSLSRTTFGDLLTAALSVVAPIDAAGMVKYVRMNYAELLRIASSNTAESDVACCTVILQQVLRSIYEPPTRLRSPDDILIIIRELATIPSICEAMNSLDIIDDLVYFVIPERVQESVRRRFKTNNYMRQEQVSYTIIQNVFEAIAALLGAPQKRKVNLLDESRGYWDPEFVPEAKEALQIIFNELATDDTIDGRTFMMYYEKIHGSGSKNVALIIRNTFERFETLDNKLTFNGFLKYHVEVAMLNVKLIWKSFYDYGFHNDLTRSSGSFIATVPTTRLVISESAKRIFSDLAFYEAGINLAEGSAIAIAMRVCLNDKPVSLALIRNAASRLYEVISEWGNTHTLDHIVAFLKMILSMEDDLFQTRVEVLLGGEKGVVLIIAEERRYINNVYRGNINSVADKYDSVLESLLEVPAVRAYFDLQAETNTAFRAARERILLQHRNNAVAPGDIVVVDTTDISNMVVHVEGAGVSEANGDYAFKEMLDEAGWFTRQTFYTGRSVTFSIYRCRLENGTHNWFISICNDKGKPGTTSDLDFYAYSSQYELSSMHSLNDRLPPKENWNACVAQYGHAPTISYTPEGFVDTDSARDDNSLNVGDDDAFEDSFPSAPESPNEFGNGSGMYE